MEFRLNGGSGGRPVVAGTAVVGNTFMTEYGGSKCARYMAETAVLFCGDMAGVFPG